MNRSWPALALSFVLAAGGPAPAFAEAPTEIGFRNDGSGRFPDAHPPLSWSAQSNVRWSAPMPAPGNASPILVGGRLFVTAEPTTLLCLDADTGRVLWQRKNDYLDTFEGDAAVRERRENERAERLAADLQTKQAELAARKREARKKPGDQAAHAELAALAEQLNLVKVDFDRSSRYRTPPTQSLIGYASITPVSDGKIVFALFANGVLVAYDLDGKRRFIRWLGEHQQQMTGFDSGSSASLRLRDGVLVVAYDELLGVDARDGKTLWRAGPYRDFGTPALARVAGVEAVITPAGAMVRLRDGQALARDLAYVLYGAPIVGDAAGIERVYFLGSGEEQSMLRAGHGQAIAVSLTDRPEVDWSSSKIPAGRYYAMPLFDQGLLYLLGAEAPHGRLTVLDAKTGKRVAEQEMGFGEGTFFPSPTLAGGLLYVSNEDGTTVILKPRTLERVAKNVLEPFRSTPFFSGTRMYVRGTEHTYCIEEK